MKKKLSAVLLCLCIALLLTPIVTIKNNGSNLINLYSKSEKGVKRVITLNDYDDCRLLNCAEDEVSEGMNDPQPPKIISGNNSNYIKGSNIALPFKMESPDWLACILIDEKEVSEDAYTTNKGTNETCDLITLKPEYLENLELGKHTIAMTFEMGKVTGEFTVSEKEVKPAEPEVKPDKEENKPTNNSTELPATTSSQSTVTKSPKTGDNTSILFIMILLMSSLSIVAFTVSAIINKSKSKK